MWFCLCCRRSRTHVSFVKAAATVLVFPLDLLYSSGNSSANEDEVSQEECQKDAVVPLPMVTVVAAANMALSLESQGSSEPTHGHSAWCHSSHNQRRRSTRENLSRSRIPSPPRSVGEQTLAHFTLHCPPDISFSCAQRNRRCTLST